MKIKTSIQILSSNWLSLPNCLVLIAITCLLFSTACNKTSNPTIEPTTVNEPTEITDGLSYLALGDSYTIGQGVDSNSTWPKQLANRLLESDYNFSQLKIIAQTGWTTTQLIQAIESDEDLDDLNEFDLVSLLIGVNNQYQNKAFSLFETEFIELLNTATSLANENQEVFVVSIPDYGVTPFGINNSESIAQELNMYNAYMEDICNENNIPFIDITTISRQLGGGTTALADDQLHPSAYQYSRWVDEILPVVLNLLSE